MVAFQRSSFSLLIQSSLALVLKASLREDLLLTGFKLGAEFEKWAKHFQFFSGLPVLSTKEDLWKVKALHTLLSQLPAVQSCCISVEINSTILIYTCFSRLIVCMR